MARARTLVLDTRVNVTGEEKLTKLGKQYETLGTRIKGSLSPGNLLAGAGIALGASQIVSFFGDAVQAAGEFEDTVSATGAIFEKEAIPALEEWAESSATAFGASKQDALAAANSMAIFGKSAGLAGQDLIDFSTELTQLGGDLASFFGGTTEDAIAAVGSALRGEFEPIRKYGVLLDAATLQQKAFELGIVSSTKNALTPQQKVLAAQAAIMEQTADAQGDFARTSDGLMNSQRILAAELENVTIEIGEELLPVMVDLVHFVSDVGVPAIRGMVDALKDLGEPSAGGIPIIGEIEAALNASSDFGLRLNDHLTGMKFRIEDALEETGLSYEELRDRIHRVMEATGQEQEEALDTILNAHKEVAGQVATILPQSIKQATSAIDDAATDMAEGIPEAMQDAQDEAAKIARQTPGALANQLRAGIDDYDDALEELTVVAENSVSDLAERQKIEGILASTELTDALNSDSTRTRLLALDLASDLIADYELIAPGALKAGELVNPELSRGLDSNLSLVEDSADAIVNAAGDPLIDLGNDAYGWGQKVSSQFNAGFSSYIGAVRETSIRLGGAASSGFRLESPAEAGPLSEPGVMGGWGRKLGEMYADGMIDSIPTIRAASIAMGTAAVPSVGLPAVGRTTPAAIGAGTAAGVTTIVNLTVQGDLKARDAEEAAAAIVRAQQLAAVGVRQW